LSDTPSVGAAVEDASIHDVRAAGMRRLAGGVAAWTLLGFILGSLAPGVAVLIIVPGEGMFAIFVAVSTVVGLLGGVGLGLADPAGRLVQPGARGEQLVARAVVSGLLGGVVGAVWTALAGAIAGIAMFSMPALLPSSVPGGVDLAFLVSIGGIGAALGAVAGTPGVVVFSVVRTISVARRWPWWVAVVAVAAAAVVTAALSVPAFVLVLGGL
jgi:hypothetical protein